MTRPADTLYIGIGGHLVAIAAGSGEELWRCKLKRSSFVTISVRPNAVYAAAGGELFCVDPSVDGAITDPLSGPTGGHCRLSTLRRSTGMNRRSEPTPPARPSLDPMEGGAATAPADPAGGWPPSSPRA